MVELGAIDPAPGTELVIRPNVSVGHNLAHEHEVHVQPLAAGLVLFVADEAGWHAIEGTGERPKCAFQAGLLPQLAARSLERSLVGFELAADRPPRAQPPRL